MRVCCRLPSKGEERHYLGEAMVFWHLALVWFAWIARDEWAGTHPGNVAVGCLMRHKGATRTRSIGLSAFSLVVLAVAWVLLLTGGRP